MNSIFIKPIEKLISQEKLLPTFKDKILPHYEKVADYLAKQHSIKKSNLLVAINGAQGTGKSTLALFLQAILEAKGKHVAVLSIDDLYYTFNERQTLATEIHPLLKTRGVPGTHDLTLGQQVINQLLNVQQDDSVVVPAFDKAQDDRKPKTEWPTINGPIDIILLEGWCVGASSMPESTLHTAINILEETEDQGQLWRRYINDQLIQHYEQFFNQFDLLIMLKAPNFDCVKQWRTLQEEKLASKMQVTLNNDKTTTNGALIAPLKGLMNNNALNRFMMHYERLTNHMLIDMPKRADVVIELAPDHTIMQTEYHNKKIKYG